jgi:NADH dehydrogenase/NADH:ubiquinone oxidoreductase subunit G
MSTYPVIVQWDGEAFVPLRRFRKTCDNQFVVGEVYRVDVKEERSSASHNHYMAVVNEAWKNLPERYDGRFADATALRKFALIKAGFFNSTSIVASTKAEAQRIAAFIKSEPSAEFSIISVVECEVVRLTAKSQKLKAMGPKAFQESKQGVLDVLAYMLGVNPDTLAATREAA